MHIDPVLKEDLKAYLQEKLKNNQRPRIVIRAPYRLDDADIQALQKKIHLLENADIRTEVDGKLLAGIVIQFGSSVIDLSLDAQLQTLEHTLYETA